MTNGGLLTKEMLDDAKQKAKNSGFKVSDEIVVKASGGPGTIVYNYNYIGDFGVLRTSGKYKGSIMYLSHWEMSKT
jgi:uncharacterized protein YodC (DUF2158 family)